jgi:glycosyltransferase involved in cell wall biosynthesis
MNKRILYIGNNTSKKTKYGSSILLVSSLLKKEGYIVKVVSDKKHILYRLLDMCFSIIKYRNQTDYILIDTFSSLNFYSALFTSQLARLLKLKYIPVLRGGNLPFRIDKNPYLSRLIFSNSHINVAPSNYLKVAFEKRKYITVLIPNILTLEDYTYLKRKEIKPNLLWVRAFKKLYNPILAIKVLSLVKKELSEVRLCMVGPQKDDSYTEVVSLVKKLHLEDAVEITGVLPKNVWHQKAEGFDILINTTNFDNTPNSVIEAMALGLTIVSTNVGGMPYLIDHNVDGVLVGKESPELMANAIIKLIKENNQRLSSKARVKAESFGWETVKEQWFKILQ